MANKKGRPKRVGMLVHTIYIRDARVLKEAECLVEAGYEVHVVCNRDVSSSGRFSEVPYEKVGDVYVYRIPIAKKRGNKFRYFFEYFGTCFLGAWRLALLHFRHRFGVIHIHNMPDILVFAGLVPKWLGAALILDVHDPMNELFEGTYKLPRSHPLFRIIRLQEKICYRIPDHLVTVSKPMAKNVAKKSGRSLASIKIIHNLPSLDKFPIREDRKSWPYNEGNIIFLYSGTVTENYRLDIAVRAIAQISKTYPDVKFLILGKGNCLDQVVDLARNLGIEEKIELLKPVKHSEVKNVMALADAGLSTHPAGPFGDLYFSTKVIEFMTQGLPVISSRTKTLEEYIPEDSIFYFEPENLEDLVSQMLAMIENPENVMEKVKKSKELVKKLNWDEDKKNLITFYEERINE